MSFRKNCADWQWRYFASPVDVDLSGFIDEKLILPDGRCISGKSFEFDRSGEMKLSAIGQADASGSSSALPCTLLTADFYADKPGTLQLGWGATVRWVFSFNGKILLDARKSGNSEFPVAADNHKVEIDYQAGRNQLAIEVYASYLNREHAENVKLALRICAEQIPLDFKYQPFVSFPDAESGAATIIFTGSCNTPAAVDYRLAGTQEWQRVYDDLGGQMRRDRAVHCIRLQDLEADRRYEYRAVLLDEFRSLQEFYSNVRYFTTAPDKNTVFRFSATADLQNTALRRDFLQRFLAGNRSFQPDFFAFLGDLYWTTFFDQQVMDEFVVPFNELAGERMPLVMVRGNHEIYGKESNRYFEYFSAPYPGREGYYMFRWGGVCFIVLDFGDDDGNIPPPSTRQFHNIEPYIAAEKKWLQAAVNTPVCRDAEYRIVLAHGVPAGDIKEYMPGHVREVIDPVFGGSDPQVKIHLYLGGHIHLPFRSVPLTRDFYSVEYSGELFSGKTVPEAWGNYSFPILATGGPNRNIPENMQFTGFDVTVTPGKLIVSSIDRNMQEFDRIAVMPDGRVEELFRSGEFKYHAY